VRRRLIEKKKLNAEETVGYLSDETKIEQFGDTRWRGEIAAGWRIGNVPNGGYILAIAAKAIAAALPHKDPLTLNAFYLAPTELGEVICEVEVLRTGKGTSFAHCRMIQNGTLRMLVTAAFTTQALLSGESWSVTTAPDYPAWSDCPAPTANKDREFTQRVEIRMVEGATTLRREGLDETGVFGGWIQHRDGASADLFSLIMFADAFPPPLFTVFGMQDWVPTVELSVQIRGIPVDGPLKGRFLTRHLSNGVMEEDGEIWDQNNALVAVCRQTGKIRLSHHKDGSRIA